MNSPAISSFWKDASGGVLVYTALGMMVFLGAAGLAIDVGSWYSTRRTVQSAADAAALAGALEVSRGSDWTTIVSKAEHDSGLNKHSTTAGATITVNNPPDSGPYTADNGAVEAIVQQTVPAFLSRLISNDSVVVAARSVATVVTGEYCLYVMNPTEDAALSTEGNATVNVDCGAHVNSSSDTAVSETGNSCLTATKITTAGGASGNCLNPTPVENAALLDDPFSYISPPTVGPCDHTTLVEVTSSTTLDPGNYCGGLTVDADVSFNPGMYVLGGQGLQIQGNSQVTGDAVTFYLDNSVSGFNNPDPEYTEPQSVYIAGSTDVELSAPTSGYYKGMLFYQDPANNPSLTLDLRGGTDMELEGVIYAPDNDVSWAGGSNSSDGWQVIVSDTLSFAGGSDLKGAAADPGVLPLPLVTATLVE